MDEVQKSKNPQNEIYILDAELVRLGSMNVLLTGRQLARRGTQETAD